MLVFESKGTHTGKHFVLQWLYRRALCSKATALRALRNPIDLNSTLHDTIVTRLADKNKKIGVEPYHLFVE